MVLFVRRLATASVVVMIVGVTVIAGISWHQGYRLYILHTGSMSPTLRSGDVVLDAPSPQAVHAGELVTFAFHSGPDSVVTHRVASTANGVVRTKGDANRTVDPWTLHLSQIVGTVVVRLPDAGYALVFLKQPTGLAAILTVSIGLALLWQLFFPGEVPENSQAEAARSAAHRRRRSRRIAVRRAPAA